MKKLRIWPYKMGSRSAKALRKAVPEALLVRTTGGYRPRIRHLVLNWGNHGDAGWLNKVPEENMLNDPENVHYARDKCLALEMFTEAGIPCPKFTVAPAGVAALGGPVVQYMSSTSYGGHGVSYIEDLTTINKNAELWALYIPKKKEYRVHVFDGKVIDVTQKARPQGEEVDAKIRNHTNGWIFKRGGVAPDKKVLDVAIAGVKALGLDFGACDVIWNEKKKSAFLLEINTAPGIEGTTLAAYVAALKEKLK